MIQDLYDAALVLARYVYWDHKQKHENGCETCEALTYARDHQRPVLVTNIRVSRIDNSTQPDYEREALRKPLERADSEAAHDNSHLKRRAATTLFWAKMKAEHPERFREIVAKRTATLRAKRQSKAKRK